jgi:ribose transport system ATP-binding protein
MKNEILRLQNVTTIQDEVTLLDNFSLHIFQGEIMGLVCINANGKESLIQLISQNTPVQYGRVYFNEVLVNNYQHSPFKRNRIVVIEQKSRLIQDLSVSDNVFVLRRGIKKYFINPRVLNDQLQRFTQEVGIHIDGNELVADLSPFEKCVTELLRAIIMGAKLIVIRDISNSVSAADLAQFHDLLRYYCQKGFSFLYICSHHEEAFKICTRVSLMRDGKILRVFDRDEFKNENMTPYYIGEYENFEKTVVNHRRQEEILKFEDVCTENLNHMEFKVSKGECTVLLDMNNTVLSDIIKLLNGELIQDAGTVYLEKSAYTQKQARCAIENGVAFIGENPIQTMLFKEMSYIDNLCFLLDKKRNPVRISQRILKSVIQEYEPILGKDINETNIMNLKLQSLYNLIYYRIILSHPKIVVCLQPFAGADMYLRRHIIELINKMKKAGITVVILAVNIADSLIIADKLILLGDGRFSNEYYSSEFNQFSLDGISLDSIN